MKSKNLSILFVLACSFMACIPIALFAASAIPVQSSQGFDLYYAAEMVMGNGTAYNCLQLGFTPADTNLKINKDGSGILTMRGNATDLSFADGKVSAKGNVLYTSRL